MEVAEALKLVYLLRQAWPTQVLDEGTPELYASFLLRYEIVDGLAGVRWAIRAYRFFPSVNEVLEAVDDVKRMRRDLERQTGIELPEHRWTEADKAAAQEVAAQVLADWRKRHPARAGSTEVLKADDSVVVQELALDPAEVERKRQAAVAAKAQLPQDSGAGGTEDGSPVSNGGQTQPSPEPQPSAGTVTAP